MSSTDEIFQMRWLILWTVNTWDNWFETPLGWMWFIIIVVYSGPKYLFCGRKHSYVYTSLYSAQKISEYEYIRLKSEKNIIFSLIVIILFFYIYVYT